MNIRNLGLFVKANEILKTLYGENAKFKEGQYEAIEAVFMNQRSLVVQKTGWGKSLVYLISTKIMREKNNCPTIIVSPLLILMENQIEMSQKLGLKAVSLNSQSKKEEVILNWEKNEYDIIFITPETLFSDLVQSKINNLKIGLLVIDEAHCISDWGHDFRLEYLKLNEVIEKLPKTVPLLATTATATNRVIDDLKSQLGNDLYISRGELSRESLHIQILNLNSKVEKYAWILENINKIEGSGIIYCLTKWDCEKLSNFLNQNGIESLPYHSDKSIDENRIAEEKFKNNEIKVIVATIKLGMGYDKSDISFVIHFHMPSNIVAYYQQIGRAGRNINNAYIFLLKSEEDEQIIEHFINKAFPTEHELLSVYNEIESAILGINKSEILANVNLKKTRIEKALQFLENDNFVFKDKNCYFTSTKLFEYDKKHYDEITKMRQLEKIQMIELTKTKECYSKFIVNSLDDYTANNCGKCSNCLKKDIIPISLSNKNIEVAKNFLLKDIYIIKPRKKYANGSNLEYINEEGICLSQYGDYGYGKMVEEDKYQNNEYRIEIIKRVTELIDEKFIKKHNIKYITFVPSINNNKLKELAYQIADNLNIECIDLIEKNENLPQKNMENSHYQSNNAKKSYKIKEMNISIDKIILIDDIIDSKWTITWCGYYLKEKGIKEVYPFALADSSSRKEKYNE